MLKTLLRKQLLELNRSFFQSSKNGKGRSRLVTVLLITGYVFLVVVVLGGIFTAMAYAMCAPMMAVQMDWLYFLIVSGVAAALGLFGSVFSTYSGLYMAKDNDLLLSMPIPVYAILASRLIGVYLMDLMFVAVVMIPAIVMYAIQGAAWTGVLCAIAFMMVLSLLVLCLACALGWVVARISVKMKKKSVVTALLSLLGIGIYYFVYYRAQSAIQNIVVNCVVYGNAIKSTAHPLYTLGRAASGDGLALLIVAAVVIAITVLVWRVIQRSFIRLATAKTGTTQKTLRDVAMQPKTVRAALLGKEKARFISSANYMLNCGLGSVLLVVCSVAVLVKGRDLLQSLNGIVGNSGIGDLISLIAAALVCALVSMNDITAPSISLEGKSLWILKSLPVSAWKILCAKLRLHALLTCIPGALCSLCVAYALRANVQFTVALVVLSVVFGAFGGALGLTLNLLKPNLNWTSENAAVKQNMSVVIALFGGWLCIIALALIYYLLLTHLKPITFMLLVIGIMTALTVGLILWIKKRGTKIFAAL